MSESSFLGFGQFSRPDIGLISDSFQNLSEIFGSDRRDALRNIQIKPEILDSLYGLYTDLSSAEDLRTVAGLNKLLLPSLNQLSEVFLDRIPSSLFINKEFYSPEFPLGGDSSSQIKSSNVIIYNGSLQCEGVSYRANTIGSSLFTNPVRQSVAVSTSRSSVFNAELFKAELDPIDQGYIKSAKYAGSIRVRRRSHVNRIFLPKTNFLIKSNVAEAPTHALRVDIDNGNTGTATPVKLLATKNTPLKVFCRMASGSITFTFTDANAPYFSGFQIQPAQLIPNSTPIDFLPVTSVSQSAGALTYTVNIDITRTGYQNLYDLYLYIYVNPEKVKGLEFSGIDIKEFPDRRDLGLIGFNNLESFKITGGSMTILPLWFKTLGDKLKSLDLSTSGDFWKTGVMGWFDIRDSSTTVANFTQLYTAVSYLTIPKKGVFLNENKNDWSDPIFRKYILNESRVAGTDYRVFSGLEELKLGDRFLARSPRLDDVFPNLRVLDWSNPANKISKYLFTNLPKIRNNGFLIDYNIFASGADGDIADVGTSADHTNANHISRYPIRTFNVGARLTQTHAISGYINNPSDTSWDNWLLNTVNIGIDRTNISINLQAGQWSSLQILGAATSQGVKFDNQSSVLRTPRLVSLSLDQSNTTGRMPSLGEDPTMHTGALEVISISACGNISPVPDNGINYLLPGNFAPARVVGSEHKLKSFLINSFIPSYRFRKNDIRNLSELVSFEAGTSGLTGRFPIFPLTQLYETVTKEIAISANFSNFYDFTTLSINPSNFYFARDIRSINLFNCNVLGGGALLPDFEGTSTTGIQSVNITFSLPSSYGGDWQVVSKRGACILDSDDATSISGLSISRNIPSSSTDPDDAIYALTGGTSMRQKVLVNDSVRASATSPELARVLSVSDTVVIISQNIPDPLPATLVFTRNTVDISGWFRTGFANIQTFKARSCRLSGTLNIRSGFGVAVNAFRSTAIDFGANMLTDCSSSTLTRIFSGNARAITIDLSQNNLSVSVIQRLIAQVADIDRSRKFTSCLIRLSGNKLSETENYSNYSQQEIFPATTGAGPDIVTSLFRSEILDVFNQIIVTDDEGDSETRLFSAGTTTRQVPAVLVNGTYYKTKRDKTQITTEDPLGVRFRNLFGIKIDLAFSYVSPVTSPVPISSSYEDPTTRTQSITDSGLTRVTPCPNGISGICWRNASNQILRLN